MFTKFKTKLANMGTIKSLCELAEHHALQDQQRQPGAEHFLLAALDLPDGTARRAFESIGANPATLRAAIAQQYEDALRSVSIDPRGAAGTMEQTDPLPARAGLYDAAESGKQVLQQLAADRSAHAPLLGAHVVAVVAAMRRGVAARALKTMGIDVDQLKVEAERAVATATK